MRQSTLNPALIYNYSYLLLHILQCPGTVYKVHKIYL